MSFKDRIPSSFYWLLLWIALKCFQAVVFVYCPAFIIVTDERVNSIQSTPAFQELDLSTSQCPRVKPSFCLWIMRPDWCLLRALPCSAQLTTVRPVPQPLAFWFLCIATRQWQECSWDGRDVSHVAYAWLCPLLAADLSGYLLTCTVIQTFDPMCLFLN